MRIVHGQEGEVFFLGGGFGRNIKKRANAELEWSYKLDSGDARSKIRRSSKESMSNSKMMGEKKSEKFENPKECDF